MNVQQVGVIGAGPMGNGIAQICALHGQAARISASTRKAGRVMYKKILFCYDGTAEGRGALRQGAELAVAMRSSAYLLAICRNIPAACGGGNELDTANALLSEGVEWLRKQGLAADGSLVLGDALAHIPQTAARVGADLIVIGYRYRSRFARWWSESEEVSLLHKISCSILVAVAPTPS